MDRLSDGHKIESQNTNGTVEHSLSFLSIVDTVPQSKQSKDSKETKETKQAKPQDQDDKPLVIEQAPPFAPMVLNKDNLVATAKEAFKFADTDKNGKLDFSEVFQAYKFPQLEESEEVKETMRILSEKFDFVANMGKGNPETNFKYPVITIEGLDKLEDVLHGKIGTEPLSNYHRNTYSSMAEQHGLGSVGAAIGRGIGYVVDKVEAKSEQPKQVADFLKEIEGLKVRHARQEMSPR